jgi:hypothetical protein
LLGLIFLVAFASLAVQIKGLVGRQGILPAVEFLSSRRHRGIRRFWKTPTFSWFNASDEFLLFQCGAGLVAAMLLAAGVAPISCLVVLWALYLSLFTVCRVFLSYQWDTLLLETGFLAIFLAPPEGLPHFPPSTPPPRLVLCLFWWLLFRLMFSSGFVKLRSKDRTWRSLTALCYHYETQPLPTRPAWYAHQLPVIFHKISAVGMLAVELAAPFLVIGPAPLRRAAAFLFIPLMLLIQFTGNYCFFNLLGIALSILLLDDPVLLPAFRAIVPNLNLKLISLPPMSNVLVLVVGSLILALSVQPVLRLFRKEITWPKSLTWVIEFFDPFRLVNSYGLFAVMTTERAEIILEGSRDGKEWAAYEFKWKPGEPKRPPGWVAPHQPRLDWQMWFAALGWYANYPWFRRLLMALLAGSSPVLGLLKHNPFGEHPPRYIRAVLYEYHFTNRTERRDTDEWWKRQRRGFYSPVLERGEDGTDR